MKLSFLSFESQDRGTRLGRAASLPTRIQGCAAILLLQMNMALAVEPGPVAASVPQQAAAAAPPTQEVAPQVPFNEMMRHSYNPFDAYRGRHVAPPSLANSPRLNSLIRDGKIYLSLRDAIDLALENNLDLVIARYNLPIAQTDVLRTGAGGILRGVNTGVVSGTPGGGRRRRGGRDRRGRHEHRRGRRGRRRGRYRSSTLGTGTLVSNYDPLISAQVFDDYTAQPVANLQQVGVPIYRTPV